MVDNDTIFDDFQWFESNNNNYYYPTDYYLFQHLNLNFLGKEKTWFLLLSDCISHKKLDNDDLLINELLECEVLIYEPEINDQETTSFCTYCKLKLEGQEKNYHESCFKDIQKYNTKKRKFGNWLYITSLSFYNNTNNNKLDFSIYILAIIFLLSFIAIPILIPLQIIFLNWIVEIISKVDIILLMILLLTLELLNFWKFCLWIKSKLKN